VVVANRLQPPHADRLRTDLWQVVGGGAAPGVTDGAGEATPRVA
jgi:hypothetical protein